MLAPERFALWLSHNHHRDRLGYTYNYHPRSDAHSRALAEFIWADLMVTSSEMKQDYRSNRIGYEVNYKYTLAQVGKGQDYRPSHPQAPPPGEGPSSGLL